MDGSYSPVVRNESHRFRAEASPADTQDDPPEEPPSFAASVIRMSLPKPLPPPPQATGENIITNQNDRAPAQNLPLPPPKDTLSWPPPNAWIANRAVNPPWNRPSTPSSTQASQTGTVRFHDVVHIQCVRRQTVVNGECLNLTPILIVDLERPGSQ